MVSEGSTIPIPSWAPWKSVRYLSSDSLNVASACFSAVTSRHMLWISFLPCIEITLLLTRMLRISPDLVLCLVSKLSAPFSRICSIWLSTSRGDSITSKSVMLNFPNSSREYPRFSYALSLKSTSIPVSGSIRRMESAACSKMVLYRSSLSLNSPSIRFRSDISCRSCSSTSFAFPTSPLLPASFNFVIP